MIDVAAGLVFREGKLLIAQRTAGVHLAGLWEFPGGKRNSEESFEDCLRRELKEELGIEVAVKELVESLVHAYPQRTVRLNFYRCEWRRNEPQNLGCAAFRWVNQKELAQYPFPPADARLLARLSQSAHYWQPGPETGPG